MLTIFLPALKSVTRYDEIKVIVLNHLEPDHTGALPELMRRAPQARFYISQKAQSMLKALLKQDEFAFTPVITGDKVSLGDETWSFFIPLICIGPIRNAPIWWKKKPYFQVMCLAAIFVMCVYLTMSSVIFDFRLNITMPTSCGPLKTMLIGPWT